MSDSSNRNIREDLQAFKDMCWLGRTITILGGVFWLTVFALYLWGVLSLGEGALIAFCVIAFVVIAANRSDDIKEEGTFDE